jgi:pantoate--beta-alanine ligase
MDVQIVECPIVRDKSGLAMSSRNSLLKDNEREIASNIYRILKESVELTDKLSVSEIHDKVVNEINSIDGLIVEYFEIVDGNTLLPVHQWNDSPYVVGCITVYCGQTPIRLIDHIKYKD